jgi:hypothetical protein
MRSLLLALAHVLAFLCLAPARAEAQDGAASGVATVESRSVVLAVQGLG